MREKRTDQKVKYIFTLNKESDRNHSWLKAIVIGH